MPSGARANDQYQYKLSTAEQIEELRKKRELLGMLIDEKQMNLIYGDFSW